MKKNTVAAGNKPVCWSKMSSPTIGRCIQTCWPSQNWQVIGFQSGIYVKNASCASAFSVYDEVLSVLVFGHRTRMGDILNAHLVWPWRSISVSEGFKYSSAIALPRRGALSKQGDRHLASLCNDHTAYLCNNQKLNRDTEQGSMSTFRWLSHCGSAVWSLWASHWRCVFSLSLCSLR